MERQTERYRDPNDQTIHEEGERIAKTDDPGLGPEGILPNLEARVVVGVFDCYNQAQQAAATIRDAGIASEDISVVFRQPDTPPEVGAGDTQATGGALTGATAGALVGGVLGLAALAIPGIGPLLAAGPLAVALGALTGGALGGLVGSFAGLGIPTEHAQQYEAAVRAGGAIVTAKVPDDETAGRIRQILERHGARESSSYNQAL